MFVPKIVKFADSQHSRLHKCPDCNNNCKGGCEQCLDDIHFNRTSRTYECSNIVNFYICKYIYKYSSEIDHLISRLKSIRSFESYNIISIGCGPCTELAGFVNYMEREGESKPVSYLGFEINDIWSNVHDFLNNLSASKYRNVKLRFVRGDAFKTIKKLNLSTVAWRPNVLILQYALSDMTNKYADVSMFLDNISQKIIPYMPKDSYIIVNDINHYKARDHFEYLAQAIASQYKTWEFRAHFRNRGKEYDYGSKHKLNYITSTVPNGIDKKYNPWKYCSSAQIIIKKKS